MPICQPVQTTIYSNDFLDKTYRFVVESLLESLETTDKLIISASAGYLLTTSFTDQPKREQTVEHVRQADGSWIATTVVTLFVLDDVLTNGAVIIRNPVGETVVITIDSSSIVTAQAQHPVLTINQPALTFNPTSADKPSFQIITIAQQHSDALITLTTDAPDYFQLASDSRPTFAPTLTLTPSPAGTYVHVRFWPRKRGLHTGQLIIHSTYEKKTIALNGHGAGRLPAVQTARLATGQVKPLSKRPAQIGYWTGLLVLIAGLGYAGYINRCSLFPALCQNVAVNKPIPKSSGSLLSVTNANSRKEVKQVKQAEAMPKVTKRINQMPTRPVTANAPLNRPSPSPMLTVRSDEKQILKDSLTIVRASVERKTPAEPVIDKAISVKPRRSGSPSPSLSVEESELERELNKSKVNQNQL